MKRSNFKDCSIESNIQKKLFLNFDEEGLVNIVFTGTPYAIMSIKQWSRLSKLINPIVTETSLLKDHFDAEWEDEDER